MSKKIFSLFQNFKARRHEFLRKETFFSRNGIHFLNLSQFFGVINDNTFKLLSIFLLLALKGQAASSEILFLIGTVYVLPFLLFSSSAGIFADRFSKQKMIVALKAFELLIALGGVIAFTYRSAFGSYTILFLFAFQSALFGPPKYSIIPEIVKKNAIAKANGLVVSFTYLAMIVGTFLASFIADMTNENYVISAWVCVGVAIVGFIASLFIPHTEAKGLKQKPRLFFLKEISDTLKDSKPIPYIHLCIFCSAFFLFIGAFFQLNIIPYAMEALKVSKIWGGYLFQTVAIGIAIGGYLAGKISRKQIELGIACLASIVFFLALFFLAIFPALLPLDMVLLFFIGFSGGFFIVPFDAFLQANSPEKMRGRVIAASNFLGFCGVALAPFTLYLISGIGKLSAATGFLIISLVVLILSFLINGRLSHIVLHYFARKVLKRLYHIDATPLPKEKTLLILSKPSPLKILLLYTFTKDIRCYAFKKQAGIAALLEPFLSFITFISSTDAIPKTDTTTPCLLVPPHYKKPSSAVKIHYHRDGKYISFGLSE